MDVSRSLQKLQNTASIFNIIDACAFFMPKAMQLKWVKDDLRKPYKEEATKYSPHMSTLTFCGKLIGLPQIPFGTIFSEQQFQTMLHNALPQTSLALCKYFIADDQFERWLDHEALYMLNYGRKSVRLRSYDRGWY